MHFTLPWIDLDVCSVKKNCERYGTGELNLALKALPVLIIGGFSSIPGAIIGGLIIGAVEKILEVYIGPFFGGAIECWAPYVLAIFFLLYRPEGLFGEKIIRRV